MTNTPDCSKCVIIHQCDTANTGNCWLIKEYKEQSEYLVKKMEILQRRLGSEGMTDNRKYADCDEGRICPICGKVMILCEDERTYHQFWECDGCGYKEAD